MLAHACRLSADRQGEEAALDAVLDREPANLTALLMRGDCHASAGDERAASSFYQTALKAASKSGAPPQLAESLRAAEVYVRASGDKFRDYLRRAAADWTGGSGPAATRFHDAIAMAMGERQIYPQTPSVLYYPYLAQRQFFEQEEFAWAADLEAETSSIKSELVALLESDAPFRPYVESEPNRPSKNFHGMLGDPRWSALYLWKNGQIVEDIAERCPRTMDALGRVPITSIGSRTPSVLFSLLRPGAHIPPHHGMLNCRLICHLPLIVPPNCWLRVGNETRSWEEGKLLIFDDSIEHEAKNDSSESRVILLFDVWRPELTQAERDGISAIFNAIDQFVTLPSA